MMMISYEEGEWRGRERGTVESSLAGRQTFLHKNFFVVGQRREASRSQCKNRSNGNWQGSHNGRSRERGRSTHSCGHIKNNITMCFHLCTLRKTWTDWPAQKCKQFHANARLTHTLTHTHSRTHTHTHTRTHPHTTYPHMRLFMMPPWLG